MSSNQPEKYPINGILDLHMFSPNEVKSLINDYIEECLKEGIYSLRIIHGKGVGILREITHSQLKKNPHIKHFCLAGDQGGWGATLVELKAD